MGTGQWVGVGGKWAMGRGWGLAGSGQWVGCGGREVGNGQGVVLGKWAMGRG